MFGQTNIVNTEAVVDGNYKILSVSDVVDLAGNKLADIYKVRMVMGTIWNSMLLLQKMDWHMQLMMY